MIFNTLDFLLFLPVVVLLHYLLPHKYRNLLLLAASYFFYASYNLGLTLFLIICTAVTYGLGLAIGRNEDDKAAKRLMTIGVVLNVGTLGVYKYFNFVSESLASISGGEAFKLNWLVPLGISFIIFQTVSYLVDVYRKKISAEKNLLKFALYVAFFPKVVQGPIERAGDILPQFDKIRYFEHKRFSEGMLMVIYGLFMKMVVADNAAVIVNSVYGNLSSYSGAAILVATLMFALQIYCDFAGYSYTAIGAARLLGFDFKENFRQPYLSVSVSEFWRRWHISLNTWLRDYVYIPLGGNRCSKVRKNFNTLTTFAISGLWHGANWGYIIWGVINGVYIIIESAIMDLLKKQKKADEKEQNPARAAAGQVLHRFLTFCAVVFAWIFFRARYLADSLTAISRIFTKFDWKGFSDYITETMNAGDKAVFLGLNVSYSLTALCISMIVVLIVDLLSQKMNLPERLAEGTRWIRWPVYLILLFAIILFGVYGYGYDAGSFIYAAF